MRLWRRDAIAGLGAALTVVALLAFTQSWGGPLQGAYRIGVPAVAVLGFGSHLISMSPPPPHGRATRLAGLLGVVALVLIITGLISGAERAFVALVADVLLLWALTTAHHLVASPRRRAGLRVVAR